MKQIQRLYLDRIGLLHKSTALTFNTIFNKNARTCENDTKNDHFWCSKCPRKLLGVDFAALNKINQAIHSISQITTG